MAVFGKREDLKLVPWFSPAEWHKVYEKVYSNDNDEQTEAYEILLAWKARMPKLPVGVDCTLSIIQVCLRDRDWTLKINNATLPIDYENDLCLMYSTAIMRFLNHISNVGHTKQTSLFQIAKQMNIPEWVVNLRHDAAHGHELPSIDVLRLAANLLLTWLHEEYWVTEANSLEKYYNIKEEEIDVNELEDTEAFTDLIKLWVATGLYIRTGCDLVDSIPDKDLQETLYDLRTYAVRLTKQQTKSNEEESEHIVELKNVKIKKKYTLLAARAILLVEISRYLGKNNLIVHKEKIILDTLLESEVFLLTTDVLSIFSEKDDMETYEIDQLPIDVIQFWQDIILLLQSVNMLEGLILRLLTLVRNEQEQEYKRHMAALWINAIAQGFVKLALTQQMFCILQHKLRKSNKTVSLKIINLKIEKRINKDHPSLKNVLNLNISNTVPRFLTDINFLSDIIINVNVFTLKFLSPLLQLVTPKLNQEENEYLQKIIRIYALNDFNSKLDGLNNQIDGKIFTIADINEVNSEHNGEVKKKEESLTKLTLGDNSIRNTEWKLTDAQYSWTECPIGILPWQIDSLQYLKPIKVTATNSNVPMIESDILPGIIDKTNLKMQSQIDWDNVLRKKKRLKRKRHKGEDDIMYKAIKIVKKQK